MWRHVGLALVASIPLALASCGGDSGGDGSTPVATGTGGSAGAGGTSSAGGTSAAGGSAGTGGAGGGAGHAAGTGGTSVGGAGAAGGSGGNSGSGGSDAGGAAGSADLMLSGPYSIVFAGTDVGVDSRSATEATFSGQALASFHSTLKETPKIGTAKGVDLFVSPSSPEPALIAAGRWADGMAAGDWSGALPADGGIHYVIGTAMPALPAMGSATYTLEHASPTTISDGSLPPGSAMGAIAVTFAGDGTKVGAAFQLVLPGDQTYVVTTTGGATDTSMAETGVFPSGSSLFGGVVHPDGTTGACAGAIGCTANIDGFFAGPNGERVGVVVHVFTSKGGAPKTVSAAFVFVKG